MTERLRWPERTVGALLRGLAALPWPLLMMMGSVLGALAYVVAVRPRHIARVNIGLCFPELPVAARERLVRRHFLALGQNAFATLRLWWAPEDELRRRVRVVDRTPYDEALASGRNVILLAPHFLALEVGGLRVSSMGPCISMYRAPAGLLEHALFSRRTQYGATLWRHDAPLRSLIRSIREHKPFYYLPDLDPGDAEAVAAPFFGIPTPTLTALARIARLADAVVLPCYTRKSPGVGGYEIEIRAPLASFPTGDALADATRMNAAIEDGIRLMPEQYLWTYKRFKRVRRDGRSLYE